MNACFFYYPDSEGAVVRCIAPTGATAIDQEPVVDGEDIVTMDGTRRRIVRSNGTRVRVTMTFSGLSSEGKRFYRQIASLEEHLRRGGWCGFAGDYDKAWASWVGYRASGASYGVVGVSRGDTILPTVGNAFGAWASGATLATGDEVYLEEIQPPSVRSQLSQVVTLDSAALEIDSDTGEPGALRDYAAPVFARHRDFFPLLRLVGLSGGSMIQPGARVAYSLDATFEADYAGLADFGAAFGLGTVPLTGDTVLPSEAALERLLTPSLLPTGMDTRVRRTDFPPLGTGLYRGARTLGTGLGESLRRWF